ncbi:MAG: AAA family ATPase [Spirochaetales bacterium]|nr:AAA family ATPase [Spirochaetales bacterium]
MEQYDPWQQCKTRSGLAADEVISALQKEIRRNNVDNAALLAYEMLLTSKELEDFLWLRLQVISVEDVGFGNLQAPILINTLNQLRRNLPLGSSDRNLFAIHAVRCLCSSPKDRSSDEMLNWIKKSYASDSLRPNIPPYALDKHTLRGQQEGKNDLDFYNEGARVSPELEGRDTTYLQRLRALIDESEQK